MSELAAIVSSSLIPPSCHLHLITDQNNIDKYFPSNLEIVVPNTIYRIARTSTYLPQIRIETIKPLVCILSLIILSPSTEFPHKSGPHFDAYLTKLRIAVVSGKSLVDTQRPWATLRKGKVTVKEPPFLKDHLILWVTAWTPTPATFPIKGIFTSNVSPVKKYYHYIETTLFIIKIPDSVANVLKIMYVCMQCVYPARVKYIPVVELILNDYNEVRLELTASEKFTPMACDHLINCLLKSVKIVAIPAISVDEVEVPCQSANQKSVLIKSSSDLAVTSVVCSLNNTVAIIPLNKGLSRSPFPHVSRENNLFVMDYEKTSETYSNLNFWDTFTVTEVSGFNFVTCWSKPRISLSLFVTPFHQKLWIALTTSTIALVLILGFYVRERYPVIYNGTGFSPGLLFISHLLEEALPICTKLGADIPFRLGFGVWLLVSVVFTQGYVGVLITSVVSPFPRSSVDGFEQLTQISCSAKECPKQIWSNATFHKIHSSRKFQKGKDFHILSSLDGLTADGFVKLVENKKKNRWLARARAADLFLKFQLALSNFMRFRYPKLDNLLLGAKFENNANFLNTTTATTASTSAEDVLMYSLYFPNHTLLPSTRNQLNTSAIPWEHMLERELIKCEQTVWADTEVDTAQWFKHLSGHYHWIKFFVGKRPILRQVKGVKVIRSRFSSIRRRLVSIFEGGILNSLKAKGSTGPILGRKFSREYKINDPGRAQALSFSHSISVVFIIFCIFIAVASIIHICSVAYFYREIMAHRRGWMGSLIVIFRNSCFNIRANKVNHFQTSK